jgi:hypothetical protein
MAKTLEKTEAETQAEELLKELEALPAGYMLTPEELMSVIRRMPKMPEGWTSADYIREMRGPLPEDDPEFQRNIVDRR